MKKFVTLLTFLIVATSIFAQKGKVTSALSLKESGELQKAYNAIKEAIDPSNEKSENSISWPRTWEVRGQILQEVYKKDVTLTDDQPLTSAAYAAAYESYLKAKEANVSGKEVKNEGLEILNKFMSSETDIFDYKEPLFASYYSFLAAIQLDEASKFSKSIIIDLTFMQTDLSNYAITSYEKQRYDISLKCFEIYLAINQLSIMKKTNGQDVLDTAIIYNAGLAAFKAKNWDKSVNYFTTAAKNDYNGPSSYNFIYQAYQAKGDTLNSLLTLKEGHLKYPDDESILVEIINFYISKGRSDEAVKYIDMAIASKPENATLYTAKGAMLEKLGDIEGAIAMYKKSVSIDSTQFTPYYNLSVIYYNRGVEVVNQANQLPTNEVAKYDAAMEKAKEHFRISLPFIEKAYSIEPNEMAILESLKTVYYRLQINDKYLEINKKIQSLK
jgi:tetratricopeptide (TPR) repeat protein